jgi:monofunctional biosynthetic peptidoglycan transglycosylase
MIKLIKFIWKTIVYFVVITVIWVCLYLIVNPIITPFQVYNFIIGNGLNKEWVSIENISPNILSAVIAAEDANFFEHRGIDWNAVEDAKKYNSKNKKGKIRGASTISMQTAKNTFLWHGRNFIRKGLELYFTILIEAVWGKKRILEVYLNIIELGEGLYGVEAASQEYFKKSSKNLTSREAALIAAVLPNPIRWSPAKPTAYINSRASTIQARMRDVSLKKLGE